MRAQLSHFQGTAQSADLVSAVGDYLEAARERGGYLGADRTPPWNPIRPVFATTWDWETINRPPPSAFDALRDDPDLSRVASFGSRGENVAGHADPTIARDLAAGRRVEIYEVDDWMPEGRVTTASPIIVAGDGSAWRTLVSKACSMTRVLFATQGTSMRMSFEARSTADLALSSLIRIVDDRSRFRSMTSGEDIRTLSRRGRSSTGPRTLVRGAPQPDGGALPRRQADQRFDVRIRVPATADSLQAEPGVRRRRLNGVVGFDLRR